MINLLGHKSNISGLSNLAKNILPDLIIPQEMHYNAGVSIDFYAKPSPWLMKIFNFTPLMHANEGFQPYLW